MDSFDRAWEYVWKNLYYDQTGLIYDGRTSLEEYGAISNLPDPEEISRQIPNPCGWGTGMEDSVLNNGSMLEAVMARHAVTGEDLGQEASRLLRGLVLCATVSDSPGFLARSVHPQDGHSHYINSSRDQYTHWVYSGRKFYHSPLCTNIQRDQIRRALLSFARRAEREIIPENDFCFLREDGRPAVVSKMWGEIDAHEHLRLPMIYAAAWDVSGDGHFLELCLKYRDEAIEKSLLVKPDYPYAYPLLQMQYSVSLLYELFGDGQYLTLMNKIADCVEGFAQKVEISAFDTPYTDWRKLPAIYKYGARQNGYAYYVPQHTNCHKKAFSPVRNVSEALIVQALCPQRAISEPQLAALQKTADALDYSRHCTYAPVLLADACWLLRARGYQFGL